MLVTGQATLLAWLKSEKRDSKCLIAPTILTKRFGLHAGILLSQLLYWMDRAGDTRQWVRKTRQQWQAELGWTEWEVRKALDYLKTLGVIETVVLQHPTGNATNHRVKTMQLIARLKEGGSGGFLSTPLEDSSVCTIYESTVLDYSCGDAATETLETFNQGPKAQGVGVNQFGKPTRKDKTTSTAAMVQKNVQAVKEAPVLPLTGPLTSSKLAGLWKRAVPRYNSSLVPTTPSLTNKNYGQLKVMMRVWKDAGADKVLLHLLKGWIAFAKHVQTVQGLNHIPQAPSIDFALKYANEGLAFYMKSGEKSLATVVGMKSAHGPSAINVTGKVKRIVINKPILALEGIATITKDGVEFDLKPLDEDEEPMSLEELRKWKAEKDSA